jgi:hypothetical protein
MWIERARILAKMREQKHCASDRRQKRTPNISNRAFTVWFRMKFEPGQEVTFTVKDQGGKEREIKFKPEN